MRHDTVLDIPGKTNWLYELLYNNAPHLHWGFNVVPWGDITHIGQKRTVCPNWSSYFFASILGFAGPQTHARLLSSNVVSRPVMSQQSMPRLQHWPRRLLSAAYQHHMTGSIRPVGSSSKEYNYSSRSVTAPRVLSPVLHSHMTTCDKTLLSSPFSPLTFFNRHVLQRASSKQRSM